MSNKLFSWKLIFKSGPLTDQSLHLPVGKLTLGRDEQCDVHIPWLDAQEGEHCLLQVEQHDVSLKPQQLRCKVDGHRVRDQWIALHTGQIINVGGCQFTIEATDGKHIAARKITVSRPSSIWGFILLSVAALCVLMMLLQSRQQLRAPALHYAPFDVAHYQRALQQTAGLEQVQVIRDAKDVLILSGWCHDMKVFMPFLDQLAESGMAYRNQVVCADQLRQNIMRLLRANGYQDIHIDMGPAPGSVLMTGNIRADARWAAVSRQLSQLPGLQTWTVKNEIDTKIDELVDILRRNRLLAQLRIVHDGKTFTVTGQLPSHAQQRLRQVLKDWQRDQDGLRVVYQNIPVANMESDIFPKQIVSFSGNDRAVSLQLGKDIKIQAGSVLPSGYIVTKLDQSGIELRKEGQWLRLPLGAWE